ncbi:hypothetical protein KCU81_g611, partial [Aureobasidium melanogenum]
MRGAQIGFSFGTTISGAAVLANLLFCFINLLQKKRDSAVSCFVELSQALKRHATKPPQYQDVLVSIRQFDDQTRFLHIFVLDSPTLLAFAVIVLPPSPDRVPGRILDMGKPNRTKHDTPIITRDDKSTLHTHFLEDFEYVTASISLSIIVCTSFEQYVDYLVAYLHLYGFPFGSDDLYAGLQCLDSRCTS